MFATPTQQYYDEVREHLAKEDKIRHLPVKVKGP
jgi:hypothetical protein